MVHNLQLKLKNDNDQIILNDEAQLHNLPDNVADENIISDNGWQRFVRGFVGKEIAVGLIVINYGDL